MNNDWSEAVACLEFIETIQSDSKLSVLEMLNPFAGEHLDLMCQQQVGNAVDLPSYRKAGNLV